MPSARVLQSCLPAAPLLIAQLILICYMFSYAPAWVVFSRAFCFCALWALPGLCLSFRPTNSLILLQCFSATCLFPSFMPVSRAFTFFSECSWTWAISSTAWWQSPGPWGFSDTSVGWFPLMPWAHCCSLLLCPWGIWEAELSLCSLLIPCLLTLKQTAETESTHFWQLRNDAALANLAKLGQCIST